MVRNSARSRCYIVLLLVLMPFLEARDNCVVDPACCADTPNKCSSWRLADVTAANVLRLDSVITSCGTGTVCNSDGRAVGYSHVQTPCGPPLPACDAPAVEQHTSGQPSTKPAAGTSRSRITTPSQPSVWASSGPTARPSASRAVSPSTDIDKTFHCTDIVSGACYQGSLDCYPNCPIAINWKTTIKIAFGNTLGGFAAYCAAWGANNGIFSGGTGPCPAPTGATADTPVKQPGSQLNSQLPGISEIGSRRSADSWTQAGKLTADDGADDDKFGDAISVYHHPDTGDYAIVGAPGAYSNRGAVYFFNRPHGGVWIQTAKCTADDPAPLNGFGEAVSIVSSAAVVGAWGDDSAGADSGAVYVFFGGYGGTGGWNQVWKITASDASPSDQFGISVAMIGPNPDEMAWIVGAHMHKHPSAASDDRRGAAYIFDRKSSPPYTQQAKLVASDSSPALSGHAGYTINQRFGFSVGLSAYHDGSAYQATAIVGTNWQGAANWDGGADGGGTPARGAAYIFQRSGIGTKYADTGVTWAQQKKLNSPDGSSFGDGIGSSDQFGSSVDITAGPTSSGSRDYAIVGAWNEASAGTHRRRRLPHSSGAAYVYVRSGTRWGQQAKLTAEDAASVWPDVTASNSQYSGSSVAIDKVNNAGDYFAIVGAWNRPHDNGGPTQDSGAAYMYRIQESISGASWTQRARLTASDPAASDNFGKSVDIAYCWSYSGTPCVDAGLGFVGSPKNPQIHGALYTFGMPMSSAAPSSQPSADPSSDLHECWVQQMRSDETIKQKCDGTANKADQMTKILPLNAFKAEEDELMPMYGDVLE